MKLGLYGGTFDPIHIAHLILADKAVESLGLDKLIIMPCANPPHKSSKNISNPKHRLEMVKRAVAGHEKLQVSDWEIQQDNTSFTVYTLEMLTKQYQLTRENLYLILGGDNLFDISLWKSPEKIYQLAQLAVAARPGVKQDANLPEFIKSFLKIEMPLMDISSKEIRKMISLGKSVRYLLQPDVLQYIKTHNLYKD